MSEASNSSAGTDCLGEGGPICLDLFCGVGGVGRSLVRYGHAATWDVVGVDLDGSKADRYPGYFIEHDLSMGLPDIVQDVAFDVAWASPPCQFATSVQYARSGGNLIPLARDLLRSVDAEMKVIENVEDARDHLHNPVRFCGGAFGLGVRKHRLFETNFYAHSTQCDHPEGGFEFCIGDREHPVEEYREAHGFGADDDLPTKQVRECIPPAYVGELIDQYARYGQTRPLNAARSPSEQTVLADGGCNVQPRSVDSGTENSTGTEGGDQR